MKELTKEEILKRELWIKVYVEKIKDGEPYVRAMNEANNSVIRFNQFFKDVE